MASGINFIDVAGAELLAQEAQTYRKPDGRLFLSHQKKGCVGRCRRGDYIAEIGDENMFSSKTEAIAEIFQTLDKRIFKECQTTEIVRPNTNINR